MLEAAHPGLRPRGLDPTFPLLLGAFAVARIAGLTAATLPLGLALAVFAPGLAIVRALGVGGRERVTRWVLAAALGVPLSAALATLAGLAGVSPARALAVLVVVAVAACALRFGSESRPDSGQGPASAWLAALAGGAGLLVLVPLLNPFVRNWSDGWFHAAVARNVAVQGVPPDFPHFAGQVLPYPWLFHVWLAGLGPWLEADPFALMAALNVTTAMLLPAAVWSLARTLGARPWAAFAGAAAFTLGLNPLGIVQMMIRPWIGNTRGWEALAGAFDNTTSIVGALTFQFYFFDASLWARLWTPTAFNFAVVVTGGLTVVALEWWRAPSPRTGIGLTLAMAGLFLWHTLTAYLMAVALAAACAVAVIAALPARGERGPVLGRAVVFAILVGAGYAFAWPYLELVTQGAVGGQLLKLRPIPQNVIGLLVSAGPLALFAGWSLKMSPPDRAVAAWALGLLGALLVAFLTFDLPGVAEEKLFYPLVLVLAACSGPALVAAWRRGGAARGAVGFLALCGLISGLITGWVFAHDRRELRTLFTATRVPGVALLTPDEERALTWVRERSPRDAVFLQWPRPFSNEPLLVHGQRRLYLGPAEFFYRAIFFPAPGKPPAEPRAWSELQRRQRVQEAVFSVAPLDSTVLRRLTKGPGTLYVWHDRLLGEGALSPTVSARPEWFVPVFESPQVRIYRVAVVGGHR